MLVMLTDFRLTAVLYLILSETNPNYAAAVAVVAVVF